MPPLIRKIKPLSIAFIIIFAFLTGTLAFSSFARAETAIISLNPPSGSVGSIVQITANLTTENGLYRLKFGQIELMSGNAVGHMVNVSFPVPHIPQGTYDVTIIDVETGELGTANFTVLTTYSFEPLLPESPAQVEQGREIKIQVNITGGKANFEYPKIKVQTPAENLEYELNRKKIFTDNFGDFYDVFTYPTDFSDGANTNFTGEYKILFNETVVGTFFVGLTDRTEYHRSDLVKIRAVDYSEYENVTITIKLGDKTVASYNWPVKDGVVEASWVIPNDALIGNYTVSVTPFPLSKQGAPDVQTFNVPGFKTEIFPQNLAGEAVAGVLIKILDRRVDEIYEVESGDDGFAVAWLERGEYDAAAYFEEVRVGDLTFNITNEGGKLSLPCMLTNLNITVVDAQNFNLRVPFVLLNLTYSYISDLDLENVTKPSRLYQTDITGALQLRSMLLNAVYRIDASRYGKVFNEGNNSFLNLQAKAWNNIVIICPMKTLQINVVDAKNQPISDAFVEARELMGGQHFRVSTDYNSRILLNGIFGVYHVKVYHRGVLLNETNVELFEDKNLTIQCAFYNLPICIKIIDYLGQPMSNVNVTLERDGSVLVSKLTEADGTARFIETGGRLTAKVYLHGQNKPVKISTIFVDAERNETNPIDIRIESYIILASFIVETAQFAAFSVVIVFVVVVLALEVHGLRRTKPK
ncbi:MAG: hypothetical protein QXW82_01610 [Candidatus Bathyarchaeia archaeon]